MEQIRISAKNLGAVMLETFCPRCFWIKLKTANKLPWQIFPGIFSSIDAYTKKVAHAIIDNNKTEGPNWMKEMGDIVSWNKAPHFSKFNTVNEKHNILLTGSADGIFVRRDGGIIIPDWKTAKYTANQDKLLPMYGIQLNGYAYIHEATIGPVEALYLVYFQPQTDEGAAIANTKEYGFKMEFEAKAIEIPIDLGKLDRAMEITREIYEMPHAPAGLAGCKDCANLDRIMGLL